jgi:hypothetical protein
LGLKEILTSREGYVGPKTAEFYDLQPPAVMQRMDLGPERAGFFSQLPYLMVFARNTQSYGILRGVHINNEVLCATLAPPSGAIQLSEAKEGQTSRELMEISTTPCGNGCHDHYINPLGFAFENFDGLGRVRELDNGFPVNTQSAYPFTGGLESFDGVPELMDIIADNDMAHECYAKHLAGFSLQRDLTESDRDLLDAIAQHSLSGSSTKDLVLDVVTSPSFHSRPGASK